MKSGDDSYLSPNTMVVCWSEHRSGCGRFSDDGTNKGQTGGDVLKHLYDTNGSWRVVRGH